ncbi:glycoside hydrolase family 6 protein [Blastococcus sp. SYSU DS0617]
MLVAALLVPALTACDPLAGAPSAPAPQAVEQTLPATEPTTEATTDPSAELATAPASPAAVEVPPAGPAPDAVPDAGVSDEAPAPAEPVEPVAEILAGARSAGDPSANPLAGDTLFGRHASAAEAAARLQGSRPADAALLARMASVPTAIWLGAWSGDVASVVRQRVAEARAAGGVPVFVAYNAPGLDCGGYSSASGGAQSAAAYDAWVRAVAAGIGAAEAVVIVEPDTLAHLCGDADERVRMLLAAVRVLEANPGTHTYLDAGHAHWIDASTMAQRLRAAGVDQADGFALNVSNFGTTADNVAYGSALSARLGGAHFVVDTSRNGNGPGDDWCNPAGRALGEPTTTRTGNPLVDAFVWVKAPGESDGTCNGGPVAGQFWPEYALALARG